ncbi:MAG: hypothetical protein ACQCN4_01235 [Candidatus Bathyarchaeia archaeon]|jgi:hypothetical protein
MSHTRATLVTLVLVLSLAATATPELSAGASTENLLFSDDFDNYAVGSFPSQWTLVFNGMGNQYQRVISDPIDASNKCFQLQGERNWAADAVQYFQSSADIIGFEVSVLVTANTGTSGDDVKLGLWKQVNWGQAKWTDGITFTDNGTILARDYVDAEGTGTVLQTYVPGQWYHIRFVLDRPNQLFSVYINGVLKGESIKGSNLPYVFDGFAVSGRYTEIPVYYDNVKIFESTIIRQSPTLTVSCLSSTSMTDFKVQVKGNLTLNQTGINQAPILLAYTVNGGKSWVDLTLVKTSLDGSYYAEWLPSATGYYSIKAVYEGNENLTGASAAVNFAVEPFQEQNVFSVNSNSTITEFAFNSTSRELSFGVSGETGTTGYVHVAIPKSLVNDVSNLKVYLDSHQIDYSIQAQDDNWLLYFTYNHSSHSVNISLASSNVPPQIFGLGTVELAVLAFMAILAAAVVLVVFGVSKKKQPQSPVN